MIPGLPTNAQHTIALIAISINKTGSYDNHASAAAFAEVKQLYKTLKRKKGKKGLTRSHRAKLRLVIEQKLDVD